MKHHLKHVEVDIGLRLRPAIRSRVAQLTKYSIRTTWFLPPPERERGVPLTPHPVAVEHGVARTATIVPASSARGTL